MITLEQLRTEPRFRRMSLYELQELLLVAPETEGDRLTFDDIVSLEGDTITEKAINLRLVMAQESLKWFNDNPLPVDTIPPPTLKPTDKAADMGNYIQHTQEREEG